MWSNGKERRMIEVCFVCESVSVCECGTVAVSAWLLEWVIESVHRNLNHNGMDGFPSRDCLYFFMFCFYFYFHATEHTDDVSHNTNGNFFCFQQIDSEQRVVIFFIAFSRMSHTHIHIYWTGAAFTILKTNWNYEHRQSICR